MAWHRDRVAVADNGWHLQSLAMARWFSDGPLPALDYFSQATTKSDLPTQATHSPNLTVSHMHMISVHFEINNVH